MSQSFHLEPEVTVKVAELGVPISKSPFPEVAVPTRRTRKSTDAMASAYFAAS
jgi:hypothetical protein